MCHIAWHIACYSIYAVQHAVYALWHSAMFLAHILDSLPLARMQGFCFGDNGVPTLFTRAGWREVAHWRSIDPERSWTHRLWGGYQATPHTDPAAGRARAPVQHHPVYAGNPTVCCPTANSNATLRPKGHKAPSSIRDAANRPAATSVSSPPRIWLVGRLQGHWMAKASYGMLSTKAEPRPIGPSSDETPLYGILSYTAYF